MPPPVKLSRNITDFFRPYSQPRDVSGLPREIDKKPSSDSTTRTSSRIAEKKPDHQISRTSCRSDERCKNSQSGGTNSITLRQESEVVGKTSPVSITARPTSPISSDRDASEDILSSSLTPLPSDSPLPMEGMESPVDGKSNCHSATLVKADASRSFGEDSFMSGRQRVLRNGEVVIANSDEETDSQDSFEDLDQLLNLPKHTSLVSRPSPQPELIKAPYTLRSKRLSKGMVEAGHSLRNGPSNARKLDSTRTAPKAPKFSLQILVAQTAADRAVEVAAQQAEKSLKCMENDQTARSLRYNEILENENERLVRNVKLKGDEDTIDQLLRAIQRPEVLQQEKVWSFFEIPRSDSEQSKLGFPDYSAHSSWASQMQGWYRFLNHRFQLIASSTDAPRTGVPQWVRWRTCIKRQTADRALILGDECE